MPTRWCARGCRDPLGLWRGHGELLLATLIGYAVGHRVGNQRVELLIGESAQATQVRSALLSHSQRRAGLIVTLFRGTGFPYAAGTLLLASCGVSLRLAMVGAVCGLGPRVLMAMLITAHLSRGGVRDVQALLRHSSDPTAVVLSLPVWLGHGHRAKPACAGRRCRKLTK